MSRIKLTSLAGLAALTLFWAPAVTRADDTEAKVIPAVLQVSGDQLNGATVQPVRWGVSVGGGGWGGGWSGRNGGVWIGNGGGWYGGYPGYYGGYGGYYQPYYGGYYNYPYYNNYPYYGGYYYSPGYYYYSW